MGDESQIFPIRQGPPLSSIQLPDLQKEQKGEKTFTETLKEAIHEVNQVQLNAGEAVSDFFKGNNKDLHQTMISIEKASVSFQMMMSVRNKILAAYEEVRKMSV